MKKTVKELIDMITNGELNYNQSTQRKFVYADMSAIISTNESSGETTKSGSLINAILEDNIQLPALYFWKNTDTNQLNIHDGKQRVLSIYYFINPTEHIQISTIRKGLKCSWDNLDIADQEKLLNYTFDIVEREGNSLEEERSFFLINKNPVALTDYECTSGMFYGQFLTDFENYLEARSKVLDNIKPIGRGEQAYKFLLAVFGLNDAKQAGVDRTDALLNRQLRGVRRNMFEASAYNFDKLTNIFNAILNVVKGLKEDRAISIASYLVDKGYDENNIINYYRQCMRLQNDIPTWDIATHKVFIDAFMSGLKLDPQRNFTKDTKDRLYTKSPRCAHIDPDTGTRCSETSYSKLEVDHITPWSKGGRTVDSNAQLLCKHHNASKGNKN